MGSLAAVNAVMPHSVPLSRNILPSRKNDNLFKNFLEPFNSSQSYDLLEFIDFFT